MGSNQGADRVAAKGPRPLSGEKPTYVTVSHHSAVDRYNPGVVTTRRALRKSLRTHFNPDLRWRAQRVLLRSQQAIHVPALLRGARLDRPIFIVGAPRSGSTLLHSVLGASPKLAHWRPGEAHEVWEADHHPALRGWASNVLLESDVTPDTARRIIRSFVLVTGARRRLIDKTPRNALRIPFIDAIFPDALYIVLRRDGRDNVNSLINAWRTPRYRTYALPEPHSIPGVDPRWWKFVLYPGWRDDANGPLEVVCAKQWAVSNQFIVDALADIDSRRWTAVRYEGFVDDPVEEVARLLKFAEVPYDPDVRARAQAMKTTPINVVTPPEPGKWRRENPDEIRSILPLIEPTMKALGYTTE